MKTLCAKGDTYKFFFIHVYIYIKNLLDVESAGDCLLGQIARAFSCLTLTSTFHTLTITPAPHPLTPADLRELRQVPGGAQRLRQGPAEPDAGYLGFLVSCRHHRHPTQHCDAICQEDFIVSLLLIYYRAQTCNVVYNSISQLNSLPPLGWVSSFKGLVVDLEEGNLVKLAEDGTVLR